MPVPAVFRPFRPAPKKRSFTLLEIVVAVALTVIIIGILVIGSQGVMSSWSRLDRHSRKFDEVLLLDRTIDSIFSNIVDFTWPNEDHEEIPIFVGAPETMTAAYIHPFNRLQDGAIRFCSFSVESSSLVVYYCERPPFPEDPRSPRLHRSVLATNVDRILFSYADLDSDGKIEFVDSWDDRLYLPLAIWIRVVWNDGTHEDWLRRTAGSSWYERRGKWIQKRATQ